MVYLHSQITFMDTVGEIVGYSEYNLTTVGERLVHCPNMTTALNFFLITYEIQATTYNWCVVVVDNSTMMQ